MADMDDVYPLDSNAFQWCIRCYFIWNTNFRADLRDNRGRLICDSAKYLRPNSYHRPISASFGYIFSASLQKKNITRSLLLCSGYLEHPHRYYGWRQFRSRSFLCRANSDSCDQCYLRTSLESLRNRMQHKCHIRCCRNNVAINYTRLCISPAYSNQELARSPSLVLYSWYCDTVHGNLHSKVCKRNRWPDRP